MYMFSHRFTSIVTSSHAHVAWEEHNEFVKGLSLASRGTKHVAGANWCHLHQFHLHVCNQLRRNVRLVQAGAMYSYCQRRIYVSNCHNSFIVANAEWLQNALAVFCKEIAPFRVPFLTVVLFTGGRLEARTSMASKQSVLLPEIAINLGAC